VFKPTPRKPRVVTPVAPRAYELTNTPLPFSRGTYFRWEKTGVIPPLLRLGGKTLIQCPRTLAG
jgi:hypothetical protein